MTKRIQLRRDTTANWESVDPVLAAGEVGVDLTTGQIKIGDGTLPWSELAYYSGSEVNLTDYATKEYVDDAIAAIPPGNGEVDLTGYATESYVDDAISAIEIPDVSSFITAEDIPAPVDLTDYALTSQIPDVSSFITAEDIPAIPADVSDLTDTTNLLVDLSAVDQSIIPDTDDTYSLGSPDKRWKDIFVTEGSLYIGDVKLSNNNGELVINRVLNSGLDTEVVAPNGGNAVQLNIPTDFSDLTDTANLLGKEPLYVAVGSSDGNNAVINTSTDGETWTFRPLGAALRPRRVAIGPNSLVYIGDNQSFGGGSFVNRVFYQTGFGTFGQIVGTEPGATEVVESFGDGGGVNNYDFREVIWAKNQFVLVGAAFEEQPGNISTNTVPTVFTSNDGAVWTEASVDLSLVNARGSKQFTDVVYDGAGFLITGAAGGYDPTWFPTNPLLPGQLYMGFAGSNLSEFDGSIGLSLEGVVSISSTSAFTISSATALVGTTAPITEVTVISEPVEATEENGVFVATIAFDLSGGFSLGNQLSVTIGGDTFVANAKIGGTWSPFYVKGNNLSGAFYVVDFTAPLDQSRFVEFIRPDQSPIEFDQIAYSGANWFGVEREYNTLWMSTSQVTPGLGETSTPMQWIPVDINNQFETLFGLPFNMMQISQIKSGKFGNADALVFTTVLGHVGITTDHGVTWTLSVPDPDLNIGSIFEVNVSSVGEVTLNGNIILRPYTPTWGENEKITITNSGITGLDGVYYVSYVHDDDVELTNRRMELFTDVSLTSRKTLELVAGSYEPTSEITITYSAADDTATVGSSSPGTRFTSMTISNSHVYVVGENKIFRSNNGSNWALVDTAGIPFWPAGWSDISYNPMFASKSQVDLSGYALSEDIPDVSNFITAEDIPVDISEFTDTQGLLGGGAGGLPTVTVPGETGTTYKGLQVSYGRIHSNSNSNELNVNKIVIHKPAVTTTIIDSTSSQDDFQVSGLGTSDVVAMFVVYGDVNGAKPLSDLQAFAESVIDLVILDGGVAGEYNTVDAMKAAFYDSYPTLALAANGLYTNFSFFTSEEIWPTNSIDDGGTDQYDTGNYISTNLAQQINYNNGETVVDGTAAFGPGSTYSFVYDTAIFGLFATGSSATLIRTSGNSGADGNSTTEAGNIYGPNTASQTFDNAVSFINLVGTPYAGPLITFTRTDYGDEVDEISEGLHITKNDQGWLYNALEDEGHDDNTPTGSLWNNDGWDDFGNVESRTYTSLESIWGGNFANIPGAKMIMLDTTTGKYWAIEFLSWTNNQQGGGASYTRQELNLNSLEEGIRFADGTRQTTAYVPTNVKLTATGNRRIEEVAGYKQVEVTAKSTVNLTGTASRNSNGQAIIWIDINTTTIDEILSDYEAAGITNNSTVQFSVDNTNWYVNDGGTFFAEAERGYGINLNGATLTYNQGDTIYFRYQTGGAPQVWWDSDDLPSGSSNFRGAVIDYHAYIPGEGTIVGTIHTVDDDGDRHITHTEVSSGSSDLENADLWNQVGEGEIRYRRIDGESSTLKIQWTAKVFYGSEYYND